MSGRYLSSFYTGIVICAVSVGIWRTVSWDEDDAAVSKAAEATSFQPATDSILHANTSVLRPEARPLGKVIPPVAGSVTAHPPPPKNAIVPHLDERRLHLRSIHTQEEIDIIFWRDGAYVKTALERLDHFLRDHRSGDVIRMDPELFMLLHRLYDDMDGEGPYEVISAHRSAKTNAMLRGIGRNVAKKSQHVLGKAMDVRLPGTSLKQMRDTALGYGIGGVGFYPGDGFIHVDTGRPRFW
ncbi:DUF882 domain-containing protein [Kordiimonas sp.]|uniref:DUF882 domain-containing protein n=1 Tax=Kordiimonas sp. TaxID=1970157 RepID=UPI003A92FB0C